MCGRFSLEEYPKTILEDFDLPTYPKLSEKNFVPRNNIAPSANILTLFNNESHIELSEMHWGIIPPWAKAGQFKRPLINARSETIWEKPSFKNLVKSKRCIILANSFYEWERSEGQKQQYKIVMRDSYEMAMAGIYQVNKEGEKQCCIVTMQSNQQMAAIHHRMPMLLEAEFISNWLREESIQAFDKTVHEAASVAVELNKFNPEHKENSGGQQSLL